MSRQSLLLLLFVASFMLNAHAEIDPIVQSCIEKGSDSYQKSQTIKSDGQCRQPFEIKFSVNHYDQNKIYTEMIADPIDQSIVQYSFGDCKLKLKARKQNGNVWFELLDAGSYSGTRIDPEFIIQLSYSEFTATYMRVKKKQDESEYYFVDCKAYYERGVTIDFKQEIEIGEPNIALIFYSEYFGTAEVQSASLLGGGLPPYPSTTTTSGLSSTTTTSTDAETTKFDSSTVATTTKTDSSSTKAVSSTSSFFKESTTIATTPSETAAKEKGMKPWLFGVIIGAWTFILIIAIIIGVVCVIRCCCKKKAQAVDKTRDETKTHEPAIGGETEKTKDKSKEYSK